MKLIIFVMLAAAAYGQEAPVIALDPGDAAALTKLYDQKVAADKAFNYAREAAVEAYKKKGKAHSSNWGREVTFSPKFLYMVPEAGGSISVNGGGFSGIPLCYGGTNITPGWLNGPSSPNAINNGTPLAIREMMDPSNIVLP